jgi:hypothetical protein
VTCYTKKHSPVTQRAIRVEVITSFMSGLTTNWQVWQFLQLLKRCYCLLLWLCPATPKLVHSYSIGVTNLALLSYSVVHFTTLAVFQNMSGRAMAQAVSRRPLTAEARVRVRVNQCGICGGQSGTGTGFSPSSSVSPVNIISRNIKIDESKRIHFFSKCLLSVATYCSSPRWCMSLTAMSSSVV